MVLLRVTGRRVPSFSAGRGSRPPPGPRPAGGRRRVRIPEPGRRRQL